MATPDEIAIARWMASEVRSIGRLSQHQVVTYIREQFGDEHLYRNDNRRWAINQAILKEFRTITADDVVWDRKFKRWRLRRERDPQDRREVSDGIRIRRGRRR